MGMASTSAAPVLSSESSRVPELTARIFDEGIAALSERWRALCNEGPCREPFYLPEWITAYMDAFAPGEELLLLTVWRGEALRGVLPLIRQSRVRYGVPIRILRGTGNLHTCRFDLIHGAADAEEVARKVWRFLEGELDWDLLEIDDVPQRSAIRRTFRYARSRGFLGVEVASLEMPSINFETEALVGEPAHFKSFRKRLAKKRRGLAQQGKVLLRCHTTGAAEWLEHFYAMEGSGWKGRGGTAIGCEHVTRTFYDHIARSAAAHNYLSMFMLEAGGTPVAMHFGLRMNNTYYVPKIAYNEEYGQYSPGQLLVQEVVEVCRAQGVRRYEFLGPISDWKRVWANEVNPHYRLRLYARTKRAALLHFIEVRVRAWGRGMKRLLHSVRRVPTTPSKG